MAPDGYQPDPRFLFPCLGDARGSTPVEPSYFYQDAWAFEKIAARRPADHIDVGSHHRFVSLLSTVVPVTMVDIRPLDVTLGSLRFQQASILELPFADGSKPSVSSLCVVEHVGLGRYGDELDPLGTEKAIRELKRVVAPGGDLYMSVPIDDVTRVYFDAHRAFREDDLLELLSPFVVRESRYIYGRSFGTSLRTGFGTGCYHLTRPQ